MPVALLRSSLLSVPHGFPRREGGVSPPPFQGLNLGGSTGDAPAHVEANLRALAAAGGFPTGRLHTVSQVHGDRVVEAPELDGDDGALRPAFTEADGLYSLREGDVLGVRVADCIPLLVEAPDVRAVAAVHSGWKGTAARIAARAVEALASRGARPGALRACVGPHIRGCCYEVSEELADHFAGAFGPAVVNRGAAGRPHLDLSAAVCATLEQAGVPRAQVEVLQACTACTPGFFSHRRDGGLTGRHLAFVAARWPGPKTGTPGAFELS
ncbi:MAG: peptidoglycan editing factor PgeF [Deltaproteobacteria bacterium]|nr:peptidoglycan editing factor PgeF [Deltaproteobacteria bacterium]